MKSWLIAQSVRASDQNSVVAGSSNTKANFLQLLLRILQWTIPYIYITAIYNIYHIKRPFVKKVHDNNKLDTFFQIFNFLERPRKLKFKRFPTDAIAPMSDISHGALHNVLHKTYLLFKLLATKQKQKAGTNFLSIQLCRYVHLIFMNKSHQVALEI